ncbi:MAG TPA: hypothetical protein VJB65_01510 [Patescibacteria group bacterium]|nr:hypothetical protein [Patescibacteria group bacterium]
MDNFIFGIQGIARGINNAIHMLSQLQFFWGLAIGFFISTLIHGFLMSENPTHLPAMIFQDKGKSFKKIYAQEASGAYRVSYSRFSKTVDTLKLFFGLSFFLCMGIIFVALLRF